MSKFKYVESNIPHTTHLRVRHIKQPVFNANHDNLWRFHYTGTTVAELFDESGQRIASAVAKCGPNDQPNRKIGRAIAVGRALKNYYGGR
jgi:hypothetical protein